MNRLVILTLLLTFVGCGDRVFIPDNKDQIDSNTLRVELLELNDEIQDLRLETLESLVDVNASNIEDLSNRIRQVAFSFDRRLRLLASSIQYQIFILGRRIDSNDRDISDIESDISHIKRDLRSIRSNINELGAQIDDVESRLVSVVYPCGEGNSQEVLLMTQDGLVGYFQTTREETISFSDSVVVDDFTIPAHLDKFCVDTNFHTGRCIQFSTRFVGESVIPGQTYNVNDSASFTVIDQAFLDVLDDGNYRTTDGFSCNFSIVDGAISEGQGY